jgi:hypothetical protein
MSDFSAYSEKIQRYSTIPLEIHPFFIHPDQISITNPFLAMYQLCTRIFSEKNQIEFIGSFCIQWKKEDVSIRATVLKPTHTYTQYTQYVMEFEKIGGNDKDYREIVDYCIRCINV